MAPTNSAAIILTAAEHTRCPLWKQNIRIVLKTVAISLKNNEGANRRD